MKSTLPHLLFFCAAAVAAPNVLRAEARSTSDLEEAQTVACAVASQPTRSGAVCAPTSRLTRSQAQMLAQAFSITTGRDVIVRSVAPTGSMRPYFDENALLLLEAVPFEELRLGDVVTFRHPRMTVEVVHRLVEKRGKVFWSKGDYNKAMDNVYVTSENFHRRLVGIIYLEPETARAPAQVLAAR